MLVSLLAATTWWCGAPGVDAATPEDVDRARVRALTWLMLDQRGDGSWSSASATDAATTATAVDALRTAGATGYSYVKGVAWLANAHHRSTDSLARAVMALDGSAVDPRALVQQLVTWRNERRGWGAYPRFVTTFPDTTLALGAIRVSRADVDDELPSIICALRGGWEFDFTVRRSAWSYTLASQVPADGLVGRAKRLAIVPTALGILELDLIAKAKGWTATGLPCFNRTAKSVTDDGLNWLLTKQKADGGFGTGASSTVFETALVHRALTALRPASSAIGPALDYLLAAQSPADGSWDGDAFLSASVLVALGAPASPLADADADGVPDAIEPQLTAVIPDIRSLASGNGRYTVTSISPSSAIAGGAAFTLTVNGSNFSSSSVVRWNGGSQPTAVLSSTQLQASIPASAVTTAAVLPVTVFTPSPGGGATAPLAFTVLNPAPVLRYTSPKSTGVSSTPLTLAVRGSGFVASSVVHWNGEPRPTTFVASVQLMATIPASDLQTARTASVTVVTPGPGGGTSAAWAFAVKNPAPTLTALTPRSAIAETSGLTFAVSGANFVASSVVRWNGADRPTTFVSSSQLKAQLGASELALAGYRTVTVFTPGPGGGVTTGLTFSVVNPAPAISALTPGTVTAGGSAFTLVVTGSRFVSPSVVRWDGVNRPTTVVSSSRLEASIPASDIASGDWHTVSVFTPSPGGGTASRILTVANPAPSIATVSPATAMAGAASLAVTISGTNFVPTSIAQWNGSTRATTFVSATEIRAAIAASDLSFARTATVSVRNPSPGGGTTTGVAFTVTPNTGNPVPTVAELAPASAVAGGAPFTLTVTGSGFVALSSVQWNGAARPTTVMSATEARATISASDIGTAGSALIRVVNPAPGGGASSAMPFTIEVNPGNPVPALTALSPASAHGGGALTLTATGTSFVAGTVLRWNGVDRPTTVLSATRLQAAIGAADTTVAGPVSVTVSSPAPAGGTSNALSFTVNANPVPSMASISPAGAWAGSPSFTLWVNGASFMPTSVVRWNGEDRPTTYVSGSQIRASVAAVDVALGGTSSVTVFTPAPGGGTTSPASFTVWNPAPTLTALTPSAAMPGSEGLTVTVTGRDFVRASVVLWNGTARPTTFVSASELRATIPASDLATTGVAWLNVSTPAPGGGTSSYVTFHVPGRPIVTGLSPSSTTAGSPTFTLAVLGTRFLSSSQILWNGRALPTVYVNATELRAAIPTDDVAATGTRTVNVSTPGAGGGLSDATTFTVTPVGDLIVDNGEPGTSFTGAWAPASNAGAFGTDSLASSGQTGATYRWTPAVPVAGTYEAFLWWPAEPAASTAVPVTIVHDGGVAMLTVDQRLGSGLWQSLGTYGFRAGAQGYVELSDANGIAIADAVRFSPRPSGASVVLGVSRQGPGEGTVTSVPAGIACGSECSDAFLTGSTVTLIATPHAGSRFTGWTGDADCVDGVVTMTVSRSCVASFTSEDIVIDDGQPGTSFSGQWSASPSTSAYAAGALVAPGGTGSAYRWTPTVATTWQYQVFLWWPADATLSRSVPVSVLYYQPYAYGFVQATVLVDQQSTGGQWRLLGTFTFPAGSTAYVEISDVNGRAAADAVRLVPFAAPYEPDPCGGGCWSSGDGP